jgi:hypothetical protein
MWYCNYHSFVVERFQIHVLAVTGFCDRFCGFPQLVWAVWNNMLKQAVTYSFHIHPNSLFTIIRQFDHDVDSFGIK